MAHEKQLVELMDQVPVPLETMHPPPHWSEQELWRNDDPSLLVQLTCCRLASGLSGFKSPAWGQPKRQQEHSGDHFDKEGTASSSIATVPPAACAHAQRPSFANRPPVRLRRRPCPGDRDGAAQALADDVRITRVFGVQGHPSEQLSAGSSRRVQPRFDASSLSTRKPVPDRSLDDRPGTSRTHRQSPRPCGS